MNTTEKVAAVIALVKELGAITADEIAERIRTAKVQGDSANADSCPLAVFITKELGFEVWVNSQTWRIAEYGSGPLAEHVIGWEAKGPMTDSVSMFVERIDEEYPPYEDLIIGGYKDDEDFDGLDDEEFTDYFDPKLELELED
jgi:hypothetical protein